MSPNKKENLIRKGYRKPNIIKKIANVLLPIKFQFNNKKLPVDQPASALPAWPPAGFSHPNHSPIKYHASAI
jgi:hypothetical protein